MLFDVLLDYNSFMSKGLLDPLISLLLFFLSFLHSQSLPNFHIVDVLPDLVVSLSFRLNREIR